jgi:Uma2 family endonuclease
MTAATRLATYQDVLDAPPNVIAEVIAGTLHVQPRPARAHGKTYRKVSIALRPFDSDFGDDGPSGWVIRQEPELHLHDNIVVPDLAAWRAERYDWDHEDDAFHTLAPDWCCEILSPASAHIDRVVKARIYADEGVGFYWVVHPTEKWIEAFERLPTGDWKLLGYFDGEQGVRIAPFDAIEMPLGKIWGR